MRRAGERILGPGRAVLPGPGCASRAGDRLSPKTPGLGFPWKAEELTCSRFHYRESRGGGATPSTFFFFSPLPFFFFCLAFEEKKEKKQSESRAERSWGCPGAPQGGPAVPPGAGKGRQPLEAWRGRCLQPGRRAGRKLISSGVERGGQGVGVGQGGISSRKCALAAVGRALPRRLVPSAPLRSRPGRGSSLCTPGSSGGGQPGEAGAAAGTPGAVAADASPVDSLQEGTAWAAPGKRANPADGSAASSRPAAAKGPGAGRPPRRDLGAGGTRQARPGAVAAKPERGVQRWLLPLSGREGRGERGAPGLGGRPRRGSPDQERRGRRPD